MTLQLNPNNDQLSTEEIFQLQEMRTRCAKRILLSTSLASSGHPGGSLSSLDLLLVTYGLISHQPDNPQWKDRDRVVMSIGHISPGVYSVLAEYGYFSEEQFLTGFRRAGSGFATMLSGLTYASAKIRRSGGFPLCGPGRHPCLCHIKYVPYRA